MSVLDRAALEESPLADLHAIASELSIDSYRRLRKPELIDVILARQTGADEAAPAEPVDEDTAADPAADDEDKARGRRRGRRGGRGRAGARGDDDGDDAEKDEKAEKAEKAEKTEKADKDDKADAEDKPRARRSRRKVEKTEEPAEAPEGEGAPEDDEEATVQGVVELLPNGSGFLRVSPPEPSDDDVYISAAQVKRCELLSGDRVAGPRRPPRRSERFASLVRIDTINDQPATELASGARFDDLPATFPSERLRLGSDDPTIKAIEWLTPFGK